VDRIHDSDEKVRAAICKIIGTLDYETALLHVSLETLQAIGGRVSDKKVGRHNASPRTANSRLQAVVRTEAATALGRLWSAAYPEM
jgi:sister-chromatid-cohesion protein PDS5